jgi:tetratricopeptide (TPR) repeat protein
VNTPQTGSIIHALPDKSSRTRPPGGKETTCQLAFARYNSGMGEPIAGVKRQVKLWVVIVALGAAAVIFGGIWLAIGNKRLDREFGRPNAKKTHHTKAWRKANSLCMRLNVAGNSYATAGMYDSALVYYREVVRISQEEGLADRMAAGYQNMSNVFDYKQMPDSYKFYLDKASALYRASGKRAHVTGSLIEQGIFQFRTLGNTDSGKALFEKALAESRENGYRPTEAQVLCNMGALHATLGHDDSARALYQACAEISRAAKVPSTEAEALRCLAQFCLMDGQLDQGLLLLLRAAAITDSCGLLIDEADLLVLIAAVRAQKEDYSLAQASIEQAQKIYEKLGDFDGVARCRSFLDDLAAARRWKRRAKSLDSLFQERREKSGSGS